MAFEYILKELKPGITEKKAAQLIKDFFKKRGAGISFRPIVAFGKNASEIHHRPTDLRLRKNHGFVMIDLGTKFNNYCSDMTRTVFMGTPSQRQKKIYDTVLAAQIQSIDFINQSIKNKAVVNGKNVDAVARSYVVSKGFQNIPHSVGHGIGKKVHEGFRIGPKSKTIIRNQMVFSIEPGIYIKNYGGVRIEDLFVTTEKGLQKLTHSPSNLHVL
jgi:Xaa-Pro aminopeptidase